MHAGIGFDLDRLQDQNREALITQIADHAAFVAAAGLRQFGSKPPPTNCCVVELPVLIPPMNRNIKFGFRCIDSRRYANLRHLRRPRLVERTMCSGNHPGPMKELTTITLRGSKNCSGWVRSDRQPLCRGWPSAAEHSFRNMPMIIDLAITRMGRALAKPIMRPPRSLMGFAEPVIGPAFGRTRWLDPSYIPFSRFYSGAIS